MKPHGTRIALSSIAAIAILSGCGARSNHSNVADTAQDPFLWLEEMGGDRLKAFIETHNQKAEGILDSTDFFRSTRERVEAAALSSDKVDTTFSVLEGSVYQVAYSEDYPAGVFRRAPLPEFLSAAGKPRWEVLLDVATAGEDSESPPSLTAFQCKKFSRIRCLLAFSPNGGDATETREFLPDGRSFVADGFHIPLGKQSTGWVDENTVVASVALDEGELLETTYPATLRLVKRGESLDRSKVIYRAPQGSSYLDGYFNKTTGKVNITLYPTFFEMEDFTYDPATGTLASLGLPKGCQLITQTGETIVFQTQAPVTVGGAEIPMGSLVALRGGRPEVLFRPSATEFLGDYWSGAFTSNEKMLAAVSLDNVNPRLRLWDLSGERPQLVGSSAAPTGTNVLMLGSTGDEAREFFMTVEGVSQALSLKLIQADGRGGIHLRDVASSSQDIDANQFVTEQLFATSRDGTRVPYFVTRKKDLPLNGKTPTLLYGYGGFAVSNTPYYSSTTAIGWLEKGGIYVNSHIRGGGEYGEAWHQAAMLDKRQNSYDDFIAIAEDLVARGITSPANLGIMGGSNGGLLVTAVMVQRPDLFGAVISQVPLTDMYRYPFLGAGQSWTDEYGTIEDGGTVGDAIARYSPYQNLRAGVAYPPLLITTSSADDRVHPSHARKFAAKMEGLGQDVLFHETTDGGHAGADPTSDAIGSLRELSFLWLKLAR